MGARTQEWISNLGLTRNDDCADLLPANDKEANDRAGMRLGARALAGVVVGDAVPIWLPWGLPGTATGWPGYGRGGTTPCCTDMDKYPGATCAIWAGCGGTATGDRATLMAHPGIFGGSGSV